MISRVLAPNYGVGLPPLPVPLGNPLTTPKSYYNELYHTNHHGAAADGILGYPPLDGMNQVEVSSSSMYHFSKLASMPMASPWSGEETTNGEDELNGDGTFASPTKPVRPILPYFCDPSLLRQLRSPSSLRGSSVGGIIDYSMHGSCPTTVAELEDDSEEIFTDSTSLDLPTSQDETLYSRRSPDSPPADLDSTGGDYSLLDNCNGVAS